LISIPTEISTTFGVFQAITFTSSSQQPTKNDIFPIFRIPFDNPGFCFDNQDKFDNSRQNFTGGMQPQDHFMLERVALIYVKQLKNITTWGYMSYNF
jgi:hypothetical protein